MYRESQAASLSEALEDAAVRFIDVQENEGNFNHGRITEILSVISLTNNVLNDSSEVINVFLYDNNDILIDFIQLGRRDAK